MRALLRYGRRPCMDKGNNVKPYIAGVVFAVLVGFSFLSVKVCVPIASTIEILAFRYDFALMGASVLVILKVAGFPRLKGKKNAALFWSAGFYVLFMIFQAMGLIFSTSVEAAIMFAIIPIITKIIAGFFLKEKSTPAQNIFVFMSVSALIFMIAMSAGDFTVNIRGIIILIMSSVCLAISNVLMRYVREIHNPFEITYTVSFIGFMVFNIGYIIYLIAEKGSAISYFAPCSNYEFILSTAYLGIACIVASSWLMSYMLTRLEAVKATIFGNLSTAVSIIAGIVILNEPFVFYNVICTAIIIAGVIGVSATGRRE